MQVKNEFVKIKTNGKEIVLHNFIFDSYLSLFSKGQYKIDEKIYSNKFLGSCYLKFEDSKTEENLLDSELDFSLIPTLDEFDVKIQYTQYEIVGGNQQVNVTYMYKTNNDLSKYYGKKIKAIGFGSTYGDTLYAYLDTSLYSIYINKNEDFSITRKDIFSSNAICEGYDYPIHLAPQNNYENTTHNRYTEPLSVLHSIGLGTQKGKIDEEYLIHNDFEVIEESDTEFGVNMKIDVSINQYPNMSYYLGGSKYPTKFYAKREIYPYKNNFAGSNKYPLKSNYNYAIFKYQLYYIDYTIDSRGIVTRLNKFYTMNYPIRSTKGLFELKNIIERK